MNKFIEMKQKDIKPLKEKIWLANDKKCPILDIEIPLDKMVLDHIHKLKNEPYSEEKGTIRTALEFRVKAFFGKMENAFKRYGLEKEYNLATMLRNAAEYFDNGAYQCEDGNYYVHPNEVPKEPKLSKRNYNKLKKEYSKSGKKKKFPDFPKSNKLTVGLKVLYEEYKINPYN
jgi:hypothetical protein